MSAKPNFLQDLKSRGLLHQCTDEASLSRALSNTQTPMTAYSGFDPTADSLHVGSLLPVLNLIRFANAGHKPIALVGGATGMIGDPSGKTAERTLLDEATLRNNEAGLTAQLNLLFKNAGVEGQVQVTNNYDWFESIGYLKFLRDYGKHFTVNTMLAKDSVKSRLEDRDHGISYTEFSYMLLQAYDYWELYSKRGCRLQLGGSDQWGNITAGTDFIRKMLHHTGAQKHEDAFGMTFPLVTKADGSKFGKSEKGNIWLDAKRTTPYEFYQFFLRVDDADVVQFLNYFTLLPSEQIAELAEKTKQQPEARAAQKLLAAEVTKLVHGEAELARVIQTTTALFSGGSVATRSAADLKSTLADAPQSTHSKKDLSGEGLALVDLLSTTGLCASKGAARKDIVGGGVYLNDERVIDATMRVTTADLIDGELLVLRKGKKNYHLALFT